MAYGHLFQQADKIAVFTYICSEVIFNLSLAMD